jgi:hypothetical protein
MAGFFEHDNERSGSIKKAEYFSDKLSENQLSNNILHRVSK